MEASLSSGNYSRLSNSHYSKCNFLLARVSVGSSVRSVIINYRGGELHFNVSVEAIVFFFCQKLAMFTSV